MATVGETFLRRQHLDLLNRLRRMGSGRMKLASEISPEKRAVIMKRIMMKAKPITEGVVPKESHVKAAIGQLSLTPVMNNRYTNERLVRMAGTKGLRHPISSKPINPHREESVVPPTSSHDLGTVRPQGKVYPGKDTTNPKLASFLKHAVNAWNFARPRAAVPVPAASHPMPMHPEPPKPFKSNKVRSPENKTPLSHQVIGAMGGNPHEGWQKFSLDALRHYLEKSSNPVIGMPFGKIPFSGKSLVKAPPINAAPTVGGKKP